MTPTYRLFALAARMSCPAGGVLLVTIGSTAGSKNSGSSRVKQPLERLASLQREHAPRLSAPRRAAAANASGVHVSTNLLAVRLLYGPLLIQNSFV